MTQGTVVGQPKVQALRQGPNRESTMREMRSKARQGIRLPDLPRMNPAPLLAVLFLSMVGYGTWTAAGSMARGVEARREASLITARNSFAGFQRWVELVRRGGDRRLAGTSLTVSLGGRDLNVRSYLGGDSLLHLAVSSMSLDECRSLGDFVSGRMGARIGMFPQPHSVSVNGSDFMDASTFSEKRCTKDTFFSQTPGLEDYGTNLVTIRYQARLEPVKRDSGDAR